MGQSRGSKRVDRRLDNKRVRQSEAQAIRGDHINTPHQAHWSSPPTLVPLITEEQQISKSKPKKNRRKWCKGKVGIEHDWGYPPGPAGSWLWTRCLKCGKVKW